MGLSFENSKGQDINQSLGRLLPTYRALDRIRVHMNRSSCLGLSGDRDMAALTDCKLPGKWGMKIHKGDLAWSREGEAVR